MKYKLHLTIIGIITSLAAAILFARDVDFRSSFGTIAFIQSGNVWVRSLPHGQPRRLTDDGLNSRPLLSSTGKWIAFRKGENHVWLMRTDGKEGRSLPQEGIVEQFKWAPASDYLAYTVNGDLWVIRAGESESKRLVMGPQRRWEGVREIIWSPDEQSLAYEYGERRDVPEGEWPWRTAICQAQTQTGVNAELITIPPPNEEGVPGNIKLAAWRGERKFFWQCEVVSASIMADGCPLYYLDTANRQKEVGVGSLLSPTFITFSPDGKTLAMAVGGGRETWTGKRLMLIDLESGSQKALTGPEIAAITPAWSPDGSHIVYAAGPDLGPNDAGKREEGLQKRRLWIMKADGTETRPLTSSEDYQEERPMFLTEKKHLVFARINPAGEASLWLAQKDGQALKQIASPISLPAESRIGYYGQINWDEVFDCTCNHTLTDNK